MYISLFWQLTIEGNRAPALSPLQYARCIWAFSFYSSLSLAVLTRVSRWRRRQYAPREARRIHRGLCLALLCAGKALLKIWCGRMLSHTAIGPFPLAIARREPSNILYYNLLPPSIFGSLSTISYSATASAGKCRFIHLRLLALVYELGYFPCILHLPIYIYTLYVRL